MEATLGDEAYLSCVAEMMPKYQEAVWNTGNESLSPDDSSADGNLHFMARVSQNFASLLLAVVEKEPCIDLQLLYQSFYVA